MRSVKTLAIIGALIGATPALAVDFTFTGPTAIPGSGTFGPAADFPIEFAVSGLGTVTDVNVTLTGLTHSYSDDLQMILVSAAGTRVLLMNEAGGPANWNNDTVTFDQSAAAAMPNSFGGTNFNIPSGSYKPSAYSVGPVLSLLIDGTNLDLFNGEDANGTWKLFISDVNLFDAGSVQGVTLSIEALTPPPAVPEPATWAMLIGGFALTGLAMRRSATRVSFA
ncbi:hypothetical protein SLG_00830 [Sphingobium sp. SYK-6]|uniref:PEPxxWA-CTERM sorting domain-containing protein n=1 Tax=Sphingobium sp. (strain NBRC 103272 / SYK-6) TaxID=627192 RepID=UPI0002276A1E|nr:PEPxxWA-CTERM sorting domain-containing protein [Sphingobium sp. SYK-6]BAK64758.1 hypothetical protein SLG_00830 [Sphingobium sp. SYK-6]